MRCASANVQFTSLRQRKLLEEKDADFTAMLVQFELWEKEIDAEKVLGTGMTGHRRARPYLLGLCALAMITFGFPGVAAAEKLALPPGAAGALEKIYLFDIAGAIADARRMQEEQPNHPLGYLLEGEALWWKMWCTSAEYKWNMTNAWHRAKLPGDQRYLDLAAKASAIATEQLKGHDSAEMQFYAGMAEAFTARFYGIRGENRATARAGIRAREHFLRALQLDPKLADADFGLGLYNYYVDTLSAIAKIMSFFMGIPGGNKQDGIRQLEHAMADGVLTPDAARFYLAINLHRYDQQYERALAVMGPLVGKYPANPLFQLALGDLYAKLGRKEQAAACYRAAMALRVEDSECRAHIQELARTSLAAQRPAESGETK
jgi:tetratricopeptide (TPR) repeat protein